jgi:DNA-binding transcriptional regulator YiaG
LQAAAWVQAGYRVSMVDLERQAVTFARPELRYSLRHSGEELLWDAQAVLALRRHMGVNQAGLAEVLGVRQQTVSEWERGVYAPTRARSKHLSLIAEQAAFPYKAK